MNDIARPGRRLNSGTDDRELFVTEFSGTVLEAWDESVDYDDLTYKQTIKEGKADTFPIIGRKRDAVEHNPGETVTGGSVEHNEVEISLDKILVDSVFVPEVYKLMNHFDLSAPYSRQLGESLATAYDKRIAILHILASRVTERPYEDGPLPSYAWHANMATDPAQLEAAAFAAVEHIKTHDVGGGELSYRLPWQQYLLLARYTGIDTVDTSGSGNRSTAKVGLIAGIQPKATNRIPKTNITTGPDKYRGDFTNTVGHISNQMAVGTLNRRGLKVIIKEQEERLGHIFIASKFSGHGKLRPECAFEVAKAARA